MKMRILVAAVALAALAALAAAPLAQAQGQYQGITIAVGTSPSLIVDGNDKVLPYKGTATFPVTVTVGCLTLLAHADEPTVIVQVENPPAWLASVPMVYDFAPSQALAEQCSGATQQGFASVNHTMTIVLKEDAPGIVKQRINVTATMTGQAGTEEALPAELVKDGLPVQFHPCYTITPSVAFPLTVKGGVADFKVTIANCGNSANMVMIEGKTETTGSLSGIGPETYDPAAQGGTDTKIFNVKYKGPATWTTATVKFTAFSHYLINPGYGAGDPRDERAVTWTFVNGDPAGTTTDTTKASPLPMLPVYAAALLIAALVAGRRR